MIEHGITAPEIVIQKMLYYHPLYEALPTEKKQIDVLVLGSGVYGQKFIDQCLQAGQMQGYSLCVTAVSCTPEEDRQNYLSSRPALSRFVNVNGSMDGDSRAYAALRFISLNEACQSSENETLRFDMSGSKAAGETNHRLISEIIYTSVDQERTYDYIFIALGNNRLNRSIALICQSESATWGEEVQCPVCYVSDHHRTSSRRRKVSMLYPVYINEPITPQTIDPNLEQMGFNSHICWNSSLNVDITAELQAFRNNPYNYSASVAFALSIPYKLFSVGILLQNPFHPFPADRFLGMHMARNALEAADLYTRLILAKKDAEPEARSLFNKMIYLEHRRWVLNMVCQGWDIPKDSHGNLNLEGCIETGNVKDKAKKTHPCIVFSTEDAPLKEEAYTVDNHAKWDDPKIDPALDELDRLSVELHQKFHAKAEAFRLTNPLRRSEIQEIDTRIAAAGEDVLRAFRQYLFCLKNILNGSEGYTRQYGYYVNCFQDTLTHLPQQTRDEINKNLQTLKSAFFPVMESNLYRDYKATDETFILKIPFILTYHFQESIALAFEDGKEQNGRNEAIFGNVASSTVLCPEKICYFYQYTDSTKRDALITKLSAVLNYLGKRRVHCGVTFVVAFPPHRGNMRKKLEKDLEKLKSDTASDANTFLSDYLIFESESTRQSIDQFLALLRERNISIYDGSTQLFSSSMDNMLWVKQLMKVKIPYFEFNWKEKVFTQHHRCDYLQYIHDNSCIRIHDMFALMNASDTRFNLPDFADDYETLWAIYTGQDTPGSKFEHCVGDWNRLCRILGDYANAQPSLAVFPLNLASPGTPLTLTYTPAAQGAEIARMLVNRLIEYGILDPASYVNTDSGDTCEVHVQTVSSYLAGLNKVFSSTNLFASPFGAEIIRRTDGGDECIHIQIRDMNVTKVDLTPAGWNTHEHVYKVLKKLAKHNFVQQLQQDPDRASVFSFRYAAPRIQKLLTSAGEILEVYTYYQMLSTGFFDDVASGYEFRWQDGEVKNELDVVATKGFRSIIIECKAVQKLELDYYHKLHSIAEHFGIGAVKVLVGNTYVRNSSVLDPVNRMQRTRGNQLNIVTVSDEKKIMDIGQTLVDQIKK